MRTLLWKLSYSRQPQLGDHVDVPMYQLSPDNAHDQAGWSVAVKTCALKAGTVRGQGI